jgi:hypothetical protein
MAVIDLDILAGKMASKLAEMDGIEHFGIESPSFEVYKATFEKVIAMLQIVCDEDWLRFNAPGEVISLPGF